MDTLITRCKRRADKENDDHIPSEEWRAFISEVWGADVFGPVAECGLRYFETTATLVSDGSAYVTEPSNHLSTIRVDYIDTSGRHHELVELNVAEEAFFAGSPAGSGPARFFTCVDDRLYLYPTPPSGQSYQVLYVPQAPNLSDKDDDYCVDLVTMDGEACLIWGVAVLALGKAKQDATLAVQKHGEHRERHLDWATERMLTQPRRRVVQLEDLGSCGYDPADWRWS
jgi:hypothetical protein